MVNQHTNDYLIARSVSRPHCLLSEIRNLAANPQSSDDVYILGSNIGFWKVVLSSPTESAYATGMFVLYLDMGEIYPQSSSKSRLVTRISPPNIDLEGRICYSVFSRNYTVDITSKQVLSTVSDLLLIPRNSRTRSTHLWRSISTGIMLDSEEEGKKHMEKYALKGKEELGREILG